MKKFIYLFFTTLLSLFFRTFKKTKTPSFLIVSTTGIGDTLWATPSLKALRNHFPKAPITLLVTPTSKILLQPLNLHNTLFTLSSRSFFSFVKLFWPMRKMRFSHAIIFHSSQRPMLPFLHLLGCHSIIGTWGINKGFDRYLTQSIPLSYAHEIQRRINLCRLIGVETTDTSLSLVIKKSDTAALKQKLIRVLPSSHERPWILFHPGAKDSYKRWPLSHFISVAQALSTDSYTLIVTGSKEELPLANSFVNQVKGSINLCGELSLGLLGALIQGSSLLITNDTGPMHMGFALQTPTLALFSPTNPLLCGPFNLDPAKYSLCYKAATCSPCLKRKCASPLCHMQTGPDQVIKKVHQLLIKNSKSKVLVSKFS
ncbi:hypothetical protein COB21_06040 [Candidatus Aerophobetes bacterium]|uniref:Glycosyltransferase family 9 protein n=1 Tax=Aerophobetes bacterium TaxID=2030807 RepID=A0A2A4WZ69_UNCAE|nr:MAG: hypothetical protein COB21_06040 [Candidatus Aerophobetes bacterium]